MGLDQTEPGTNLNTREQAHVAAYQGDLSRLKELREKYGEEIFVRDESGWTLINAACAGGNLELVQWLVQEGADVNERDGFGGSPLFEAVRGEHEEVAEYLRNKGARLSVPRGIKIISYMQFTISGLFLVIIAGFALSEHISGADIIIMLMLAGGVILGILEGIKGLRGRRTFANSG